MLVQEDDSALIAMALNKSLFTAAEADEAKRVAERTGRPVSDVLVEKGLLAARTIDSLRAEITRTSGLGGGGATDRTTATPPPAPPGGKLPVPCVLGDYEIVQKLGEGGMGAVYRARQGALDREVALKVMSPHVMEEPEFVERFEREARAMAKINDPHVITVYDTRKVEGRLIMSLELMRGGDAAQLAEKSGGKLPEARALAIGRDCARGLQALEKAGLVHRDIKPANVFMGDDGQAKLADLGLARIGTGDDRMTKSGMIVGTPAFMAPEQADGEANLDVRTDIYAVGATIFQLVTGSPPYTGSSALVVVSKVLTAPVPDPRSIRPDVSALTAELVMKALAKDRAERFQTATELLVAVERSRVALGGGRPSGRLPAQPQPARPSGRLLAKPAAPAEEPSDRVHPAAIGVGAVVLVAFLAAAVSMVTGRERLASPAASPPPAVASPPRPTPTPTMAAAVGEAPPVADAPAEPDRVVESTAVAELAVGEAPPVADASAEPDRVVGSIVDVPLPTAPTPQPVPHGPVQFTWQSAPQPARITNGQADGVVRIEGQGIWGRTSGTAGPIAVPATVQFKVFGVTVSEAVKGDRALADQGFTSPYGFFCELGLRAEPGHAFAGADLQNTLWLSVNFGRTDVFGLLRAVGERQPDLSLARRPSGLKVFGAPGFTHRFDATREVDVVVSLSETGWMCRVVTHGRQWSRDRRSEELLRTRGSWSDLGLERAPRVVWAWAHAGNWAEGRGEGSLQAGICD